MAERETHVRRPRALDELESDLAFEIERHMRLNGLDVAAVATRARLARRSRYRFEAWLRGDRDADFRTLSAMVIAEQIGVPIAFLCGDEARSPSRFAAPPAPPAAPKRSPRRVPVQTGQLMLEFAA